MIKEDLNVFHFGFERKEAEIQKRLNYDPRAKPFIELQEELFKEIHEKRI